MVSVGGVGLSSSKADVKGESLRVSPGAISLGEECIVAELRGGCE